MNNCINATPTDLQSVDRPIVVYFISVFSVILIIPYIFTLYVFYANFKDFANYAYHTCLFAVGIYDVLTLVKTGLFDAFVDRDSNRAVGSRDLIGVSWMLLFLFYFGQLWATTVMTVNRAVSTMWWAKYDRIFSVRNTIVFNVLASVTATCFALPFGVPNVGIVWTDTCLETVSMAHELYMLSYILMMTILISGNLALYVALFLFIRNRKIDSIEADKSERKILYQSFFIVVFHFVIYIINGIVLLGVSYTVVEHPLAVISVLNAGMNPFQYLKFSSKFQRAVIKMFKLFKQSTAVTVAPLTYPPQISANTNMRDTFTTSAISVNAFTNAL